MKPSLCSPNNLIPAAENITYVAIWDIARSEQILSSGTLEDFVRMLDFTDYVYSFTYTITWPGNCLTVNASTGFSAHFIYTSENGMSSSVVEGYFTYYYPYTYGIIKNQDGTAYYKWMDNGEILTAIVKFRNDPLSYWGHIFNAFQRVEANQGVFAANYNGQDMLLTFSDINSTQQSDIPDEFADYMELAEEKQMYVVSTNCSFLTQDGDRIDSFNVYEGLNTTLVLFSPGGSVIGWYIDYVYDKIYPQGEEIVITQDTYISAQFTE